MRPMRRAEREVTEEAHIREILEGCETLRLGLWDGDEVYVVPVSYGYLYEEGRCTLYFHGSAQGRKAEVLARAACRLWDTKPQPLLRKTRDNPPQSGLRGPAARRANVLGIYEAEEARCAGRRVLLVDDIVTTGATLEECARTLREAGAAEVLALTLGRTREKSASPGKTGQKGKNLP